MKVAIKKAGQSLRFNSVPQELKGLPQWVVWKLEDRGGKPTKPPYDARTGFHASSTDPKTFCTFQEAVAALESGRYKGIGFVFTDNDPYAGIDLDDCRSPVTGEITAYAQRIIDDHPTYWEVSPSGTGVKGFLKTRLPVQSKRKKINGVGVELYGSGRFFTVTGEHSPKTLGSIGDCTSAFSHLYQTLSQDAKPLNMTQQWVERKQDPLTDGEILDRLFNEKERGAEWRALYNHREWSKDKSDSEADAALLFKLAYYAGPDGHTQIERLARGSALDRPKWNSKRKGNTWLTEQIIRACDHRRGETGSLAPNSLNNLNPLPSLNILDYVVKLDTVEAIPIKWLWDSFIPAGKVSLLSGDPGLGKTTAALDIAARLSVGRSMPNSLKKIVPSSTLILTAEDDLADTIKPRIISAKGDPSKIIALPFVPKKDGENIYEQLPSLPEDVESLRAIIEEFSVKLVIIDPMMAYLSSRIDAHKDQDVRRALSKLKALAEDTGAAILLIRHLNKSNFGKALYAGGGSIGITAAVRSEIICTKDPENENGRILVLAKSNLSAIKGGLKFHLKSHEDDTVAHCVWDGVCDKSADELLSHSGSRESVVDKAETFLKEALANGARFSTKVEAEAKAAGISQMAIRRAKTSLKVISQKVGRVWQLRLPEVIENTQTIPSNPVPKRCRTRRSN